ITDEQARALGVELITLTAQPEASGMVFPAQIVLPPQSEQVVSAPVAGVIKQMLVQENQAVVEGMPLLILNSPDFGQLQLAAIQANSRAKLAQQAMLREQALFNEGIIPRRRIDEANAAMRDADAEMRQTLAALQLAGVSEVDSNRIANADHVKSELIVSAQSGGIVTALSVKPGQRVSMADPLLHVTAIDTLWLDVQVPSGDVARWPIGSTLSIPGGITAKVLSVSPIASGAQTVLLRAQLNGGTQRLHPGEFVQAELPMPIGETWDVPVSAIARDGEQAYVFEREAGQFVATPITVVASAGQRAKVSGALKAGQRIAASSVVALKAAWQGLGGAEEE
ncbi:MAG TPA: efflux RND transporter periplasmic adaptor subunit, partial [Pseudomonadales bacterium]|nr:efflux RND transporter periplasmic adaptor subunit [Pseudomonadales bacterium]